MNRWSDVQSVVTKFASCMDDKERRRPSKMNEREREKFVYSFILHLLYAKIDYYPSVQKYTDLLFD